MLVDTSIRIKRGKNVFSIVDYVCKDVELKIEFYI